MIGRECDADAGENTIMKYSNRKYSNIKQMNLAFAILVTLIYECFCFLVVKLAWDYGFYVPLSCVNGDTVITRLLFDCVLSVPFVISLLVVMKSKYFRLKPHWEFENGHIVALLSALYVLLCLYKRRMTVNGLYLFGFYLFFVGFFEEFMFRGFLFSTLSYRFEWKFSAFIAGAFWCIPHMFIPFIKSNAYMNIGSWVSEFSYSVGELVVSGIFFSWILLKGKNIFIPVLIHALLDSL